MAVKNKVMCYSIFVAGVLSLSLMPAFAGEYGSKEGYHSGKEGGMAGKEHMRHRWFQKMDKDGDGKISQDEFEEATEKKFKHLDANGDGSVTQEEWEAAAEKWRKKHMKGHYRGGSEGSEGHNMEGEM